MATNIDIQGLRDPSCRPTKGMQVEMWPIDRFVFYARNPRKNDAAVDRMCASIREFGFKIAVLARSDVSYHSNRRFNCVWRAGLAFTSRYSPGQTG